MSMIIQDSMEMLLGIYEQVYENFFKHNLHFKSRTQYFIRILMTEVFADVERVTKWFGPDWNQVGSHIPNNFAIISNIDKDTNASEYKQMVDDWMLNMPSHANGQGSWILGNHDRSRVASRFSNRHESMAIMSMILPGVALIYYVSDEFEKYEKHKFIFFLRAMKLG